MTGSAKQSILSLRGTMDCFAWLAMTVSKLLAVWLFENWIGNLRYSIETPNAPCCRMPPRSFSSCSLLLVPQHRDYDWLILSQSRMGKFSGATRIWMLLATPG
jgi:hypothetical protein